jgi:hypothetical protein
MYYVNNYAESVKPAHKRLSYLGYNVTTYNSRCELCVGPATGCVRESDRALHSSVEIAFATRRSGFLTAIEVLFVDVE